MTLGFFARRLLPLSLISLPERASIIGAEKSDATTVELSLRDNREVKQNSADGVQTEAQNVDRRACLRNLPPELKRHIVFMCKEVDEDNEEAEAGGSGGGAEWEDASSLSGDEHEDEDLEGNKEDLDEKMKGGNESEEINRKMKLVKSFCMDIQELKEKRKEEMWNAKCKESALWSISCVGWEWREYAREWLWEDFDLDLRTNAKLRAFSQMLEPPRSTYIRRLWFRISLSANFNSEAWGDELLSYNEAIDPDGYEEITRSEIMVDIIKALPRLEEVDFDVVSPRQKDKWKVIGPIFEALKGKNLTGLGLHGPDNDEDQIPDIAVTKGWVSCLPNGADGQLKMMEMFGIDENTMEWTTVRESEMKTWCEMFKDQMRHLMISTVDFDDSSVEGGGLMDLLWFDMPKLIDMTVVGVAPFTDTWLLGLSERIRVIGIPQLECRLTSLELHACPNISVSGLDALLSLTKELRILRCVGVPDEDKTMSAHAPINDRPGIDQREWGCGKPYQLKKLWCFDYDNCLGLVWFSRFIGSPLENLDVGEMGTDEDANELESFLFDKQPNPFPELKRILLKNTHELDKAHEESLEMRCYAKKIVLDREEDDEDDSDVESSDDAIMIEG